MNVRKDDRGVVAVEFALIAPVILTLLLGTFEFSSRFERAGVLNNAAFVAAKDLTVNHDLAKATALARKAGAPDSAVITVTPNVESCTTGSDITVTIKATEESPTKAFGATFVVKGTGVARCDD
jgi:Flp pilus assembly protein TadG